MARARPGVLHAARATLLHEGAPEGDLTLALTSAARIRELNHRFAGEDRPTDVLSFVDGANDAESGRLYFGDVLIAVPVAEEQAEAAGHSLAEEMRLLTVHGVLHLLGHDHARPADRRRMEESQRAILGALRRASAASGRR
jgi:probable rRNA maturation factor